MLKVTKNITNVLSVDVDGLIIDMCKDRGQVMQWTTEKPSQSGYYWGYENLDEIDADVILVHVTHDSQQCFGLGVTFSVDDFSHWIGPLSIPVNPHHSYSGQDSVQLSQPDNLPIRHLSSVEKEKNEQ